MQKGYTHIYTGNGKGKTTAAIGLAVRAIGAGKKVYIGQFVKSMKYAEVEALKCFGDKIEIEQLGLRCFINEKPCAEDKIAAEKAADLVEKNILSGIFDLVILDEINIAIHFELVSTERVLQIINNKPEDVELILTGRYAPQILIDAADIVTEMKEIKHYYSKGVEARDGIER